ncbi:hypothetical protein V2A60_000837 [Cordyceps javanica]
MSRTSQGRPVNSRTSQGRPINPRNPEWLKMMRLAIVPIGYARRLQWSFADLKGCFHLANWSVKRQDLDLTTGCASNGQCLLKPRAPIEVERMLNTAEPWLCAYNPAEDFPSTLEEQLCVETPFNNAMGLWAYIFPYLEGSAQAHLPGIVGRFSRWWCEGTNNRALEYYGKNKKFLWKTLAILTRIRKPSAAINWASGEEGISRDFTAPHILGVIANMAPMLPRKISMAEIAALVHLAEEVVVSPEYSQHKIIPITIFNLSDRSVRITQGCFDLENRKLDINVAPVLDFSISLLSPSATNFYQLLGWFISEPIGKTD